MPNRVSPIESLPNGYRLVISADAGRTLLSFGQRNSKKEAGGILLGKIFDVSRTVLIEKVTTPHPKDRRGWNFFVRSRSVAQNAIDNAWADSGGEQIYLGEWHSHPEPHPTPSHRDRCMIRNLFKQSKMEIDFLLTIIVGWESVWVGSQTSSGLTEISTEWKVKHDR